ncbi:alpha/beta hydrolase family protein [Paenibacillus sp. GCM10012307]|uniref:Alpha/beta fold hydrolase n=1 Tax=Paenibacillus roseus TaxID=2798579 RepID=A0A934J5B3_9BACL|nr:alpha/beta fold hydrolase [Paenibacillus roseus]MBJ6360695.1 alpha/beta fold hydrolase [Paenibacillus roseus]
MPIGDGPFPAVVLVHGSGPHDRDSTIGGAKVFHDLAVGLASQKIAVLQYDKVTYQHTMKSAFNPLFTIKEETVDDALRAVDLLRDIKDIDSRQIYVAGHSQGAFAIPLILEGDTSGGIAGTVMIASPAGTFQDVLSLQQQELLERMKKLHLPTDVQEQNVTFYKELAALINDKQYSKDNLPKHFPIQSAYWWYAMRDYRTADKAALQTGPLLVLQGENDWQVPLTEFQQLQSALKNRRDVTFKSYPHVNHLLAEYKDVSVGIEYAQPSNVSPQIIQDIAAFIKK